VATGAILQFGSSNTATSNVLSNTAAISLAGGTLQRASGSSSEGTGSSVGLGALSVTASSTLDFGVTGAGTLTFASLAFPGDFKLTISDWQNADFNFGTNAPGLDGTDDRLLSNTSLTAQQLQDISFGTGLTTKQIDLQNGFYEIGGVAAVPEPGSLFLILAGAGALLPRRRRARS
jgi:hypothetical protein